MCYQIHPDYSNGECITLDTLDQVRAWARKQHQIKAITRSASGEVYVDGKDRFAEGAVIAFRFTD